MVFKLFGPNTPIFQGTVRGPPVLKLCQLKLDQNNTLFTLQVCLW